MEDTTKRVKKFVTPSRGQELRRMFRSSFSSPQASLIPLEIWKMALRYCKPIPFARISVTCSSFREVCRSMASELIEIAEGFRERELYSTAREYLLLAIIAGSIDAMNMIARSFLLGGWGLTKDFTKSTEWFKKTADAGDGEGMAGLARCKKYGNGVEQDDEAAAELGRRALQSGSDYAHGLCYYWGLGVEADNQKCFECFSRSADAGHQFGEFWVGFLNENGIGTVTNLKKAMIWYVKSAEHGVALAQFALAEMIHHGLACKKNEKLATSWYQKAASQGHVVARQRLQNIGCESSESQSSSE